MAVKTYTPEHMADYGDGKCNCMCETSDQRGRDEPGRLRQFRHLGQGLLLQLRGPLRHGVLNRYPLL